jgi:hypothetical protein
MKKLFPSIAIAIVMIATPAFVRAQNLPAGTAIPVTLDQAVSSKDAKAGQILPGTVSADVMVNGKTLIPKGSKANLRVSSAQASGRLSTPARLYIRLDSVMAGGKTFTVSTQQFGRQESGKGKRDAVGIGGGAAVGAIIGAVAGGGKGAAIGSAAGAGVGTAGAAATGKKDIEYAPETRIKFITRAAATAK